MNAKVSQQTPGQRHETNEDTPRHRSSGFWKIGPKWITAIAALITALTTLGVVAGFFSGGGSGAPVFRVSQVSPPHNAPRQQGMPSGRSQGTPCGLNHMVTGVKYMLYYSASCTGNSLSQAFLEFNGSTIVPDPAGKLYKARYSFNGNRRAVCQSNTVPASYINPVPEQYFCYIGHGLRATVYVSGASSGDTGGEWVKIQAWVWKE
jgi:hypothetical protein